MPEDTYTHVLLGKYSRLYDGPAPEVASLLKGIGRQKMLTVTAFLLSFYNRGSEFESPYKMLSMFFCEENNGYANEVWERIQALQKETGAAVKLISPQTALQLFEYAFNNLNDEDTQTKAEVERNVFEAILVQNEFNTKQQDKAGESTAGIKGLIQVPLLQLAQSFAFSELVNYDIYELWGCQLIKSVMLFQFLEANDAAQPLLTAFLAEFGAEDWRAFLKKLVPLTFPAVKNEREGHTDIVIPQDEHFGENVAFLEKMIVQDEEMLADIDYRKTRSRPFYKVEEGVYRIIFSPFAAEILHKGIYFKLNEINATLPKGEQIKNFRSFYTDEFSERWLLYKILDNCFDDSYLKFTGTQMKDSGLSAEPDYYCRRKNDMFLFESKDILINAAVKQQYDFALQEAEFKKKLYYEEKDGKKANKAVLQLMLNIERALTMQFPFDKDYDPAAVNIYPVLVLHDHSYRAPGLNQLVNSWFQTELKNLEAKGLQTGRVRYLTIIDSDTLIYRQDIFRKEQLNLGEMISAYQQYTVIPRALHGLTIERARQVMGNKTVPFATWLTGKVADAGLEAPPEMLNTISREMFAEQRAADNDADTGP